MHGAFRDVAALPDVQWLFALRSSEMFLRLWRDAAHVLCVETVAARTAALAVEAEEGSDGDDVSGEDEESDGEGDGDAEGEGGEDGEGEEERAAREAQRAERRARRAAREARREARRDARRFVAQDRRAAALEVLLSQNQRPSVIKITTRPALDFFNFLRYLLGLHLINLLRYCRPSRSSSLNKTLSFQCSFLARAQLGARWPKRRSTGL